MIIDAVEYSINKQTNANERNLPSSQCNQQLSLSCDEIMQCGVHPTTHCLLCAQAELVMCCPSSLEYPSAPSSVDSSPDGKRKYKKTGRELGGLVMGRPPIARSFDDTDTLCRYWHYLSVHI